MNRTRRAHRESLDSGPRSGPQGLGVAFRDILEFCTKFAKRIHDLTDRSPEPAHGSYCQSALASLPEYLHEIVDFTSPAQVMEVTDHIMMDIAHMTPAAHEKMAMDQFARFDANSDGMLSKAEFVRPRGK
jgi:hypothetical protein